MTSTLTTSTFVNAMTATSTRTTMNDVSAATEARSFKTTPTQRRQCSATETTSVQTTPMQRSREVHVEPQPTESPAARWYGGQVVTASEQSTLESQTSTCADSSHQAAGLTQQSELTFVSRSSPNIPRLRANSGKQDERDLNGRVGERVRQRPVSESTPQSPQRQRPPVSFRRNSSRVTDDGEPSRR